MNKESGLLNLQIKINYMFANLFIITFIFNQPMFRGNLEVFF